MRYILSLLVTSCAATANFDTTVKQQRFCYLYVDKQIHSTFKVCYPDPIECVDARSFSKHLPLHRIVSECFRMDGLLL